MRPRWSVVALSACVVLATYALLIETWRQTLEALGGTLARGAATVIWLGSSLARYLPLSGWQLGVMTLMARRRNVPVTLSAGTSVVITITNLLTGLLVFTASSASVPTVRHSSRAWLVVAGVVALACAPFVLPRIAAIAKAVTGRELVMPRITPWAVVIAAVGTTVAWLLYGVAFWILTQSVFPNPGRNVAGCIALYVGSYLAGLISVVPPAGLGVAEVAMVELAAQLGTFGRPEAAVLAIVVRVWRTALEIVPGVVTLGVNSLFERERS